MTASMRCALAAILIVTPVAPVRAQEPITARVDQVFAAYDRSDSPGCALAVYRAGEIVYARGYGMANLQAGVPITSRTVFDIGSTSKQFTAASIILLAQQGRLSLDDDVRQHLPELPTYGKPITIRHLLYHTSGLRDYIGLLTLGGLTTTEHTTAKQAREAIVRQKALNFEPGSEHLYSNSGYFLLSQIIERVSGKSMRAFAQEHIFGPLGMRATYYHDDYRLVVPERATGYAPDRNSFRVALSDWEQTGDGAVNTTVEDLLLWDRNFYQPKVGGQALLKELHTTGKLNSGTSLTYAAGLQLGRFRGLETVSHGGSWAGYRADLVRFPAQRLSVATLCNVANANPSGFARAVAAIYLEDEMSPAPAPPPPAAAPAPGPVRVDMPEAQLRAWPATYRHEGGTMLTVTLEAARLMIEVGPERVELVPIGASEFTVTTSGVTRRLAFDRTAAGKRRIRQLDNGRVVAEFEEVQVVQPSATQLQAYAGEYFSDELNVKYVASVQGDALLLIGPVAAYTLRALAPHEFAGGAFTLQFTAGANGAITGFALNQGRVRGIRFERTGGARE